MSENNDTIKYLMQAVDLLTRARVVMEPKFEDDPRDATLEMVLREVRSIIDYLQSGRDPVAEMLERQRILDELMHQPLMPFVFNVLPPAADSREQE